MKEGDRNVEVIPIFTLVYLNMVKLIFWYMCIVSQHICSAFTIKYMLTLT